MQYFIKKQLRKLAQKKWKTFSSVLYGRIERAYPLSLKLSLVFLLLERHAEIRVLFFVSFLFILFLAINLLFLQALQLHTHRHTHTM